ncbi:MAG: hypothetical protein US49_C0006G0148 [candidate division TM6 bacterium GW2011_GWF2_37_49]|nr:MAG: hypothetical protein US49_C0006G0148 [candidate division TM6 bacterium GW2011_GWF2_37_49]
MKNSKFNLMFSSILLALFMHSTTFAFWFWKSEEKTITDCNDVLHAIKEKSGVIDEIITITQDTVFDGNDESFCPKLTFGKQAQIFLKDGVHAEFKNIELCNLRNDIFAFECCPCEHVKHPKITFNSVVFNLIDDTMLPKYSFIHGNNVFNGNGFCLININLTDGSTAIFENLILTEIPYSNCAIKLKNVEIALRDEFMLIDQGIKIKICKNVEFCTSQNNKSVLILKCDHPIKIDTDSTLFIDKNVLCINASKCGASPFLFTDKSSQLFLNGCSLLTLEDITLTRGQLTCNGISKLGSSKNNVINLGNGNLEDDFYTELRTDLQLVCGTLAYKNAE